MSIELPELPYAPDALEPTISAETIEYHYGKHHRGYVNKLIAQVGEDAVLEDVIANSEGATFNNAAQVWNHSFYWQCMTPGGSAITDQSLQSAIDSAFGSTDTLKQAFTDAASSNFASGWTWLVIGQDGKLEIENTNDADTPIAHNRHPILTVDVWEHAYYIDYRNGRKAYLANWWNIINWTFVASQYRLHTDN